LGDTFLAGDWEDFIGKEGKPRDCITPGGGGTVWKEVYTREQRAIFVVELREESDPAAFHGAG
jgi:hypothetical protein